MLDDVVVVVAVPLLGLGLARLAFSMVTVLLGVAEIEGALALLLSDAGFSVTESVDVWTGVSSCDGGSMFCFVEPVVLDGVVVVAVLLLELGLACLALSSAEVVGGLSLSLSGFSAAECVDVSQGASNCAGVSTSGSAEASLGVSSTPVLFVDMDDAIGMVINRMHSFMRVDVPGETSGELSFAGKSHVDGAVISTGLPGVFMVDKGLSEGLFVLVTGSDGGLTVIGESTASIFFTF